MQVEEQKETIKLIKFSTKKLIIEQESNGTIFQPLYSKCGLQTIYQALMR